MPLNEPEALKSVCEYAFCVMVAVVFRSMLMSMIWRKNYWKTIFSQKKIQRIKTNHVGININFYLAELWDFLQSYLNLYAGNSSSTKQNGQWIGKIKMEYTLLQEEAAHISRLAFPHCCLCESNLIYCPNPNGIFYLLFCCLYSLPNVK